MSAAFLCVLCLGLGAVAQPATAAATATGATAGPPPVLLSPMYYVQCRRPCQYAGFSFDDTVPEMRQMRADGANAVGSGSMWVPTKDPSAPYGCGIPSLQSFRGTNYFGQSFTIDVPFTGVALATPTFNTTGGGCTLSLYREPPDRWGATPPKPLATHVFTGVKDNQQTWLTFPRLPAGSYYVEQSKPTGPGIGVWAVGRDAYSGGTAFVNRKPVTADDLELRCRTASGDRVLVAQVPTHHSLRLGPGVIGRLVEAGMHFDYSVGNWNNGGFPYYPEWFIKRFPDFGMQDMAGKPILAGMFGDLVPVPSIDEPVIVNGTERYIRAVVGAIRNTPNLVFWCMGGEALYPTYGSGVWTDYAPDAVAHYRAWLGQRYGDVARLNAAWGTHYASFDQVSPPKPPVHNLPSLDWMRYRYAAMAQRFVYHFAATKGTDPTHLVACCNHGDLFTARDGMALGEDMNLYAGSSDGWEMGQIMSDADSDLYNLMWMRTAGSFGKPLCPVRLAYKKTNPKARGGGTSYTPAAADRYFWESVGTGAWDMGFIQWRGSLPDGEWGIKGTPAQAAIKRILTGWHRIAPYFDDAWPVSAKVGLYLSQDTWTMDGFSPLWTRLNRDLTQRQIGVRMLLDTQVLDGDLDDCAMVVSADNRIMSRACVDALRRYAAGGGELVLVGANGGEDGNLARRKTDPFAGAAGDITRLTDTGPALTEALVRLIDARKAHYLTVTATSSRPYYEAVTQTPVAGHDTPFDLATHKSMGQTFTTTEDGLRSVGVTNPTYTHTVKGYSLTIEVLAGGPGGRVLGRKTFPADELGDNARHDVPIDPPAPAGKYYLRLITPRGLPSALLGVWGRGADVYAGGSRYVDDKPETGDLELWLNFLAPRPARAALEAFPLSDGLNALVVLINIGDSQVRADLQAAPELVPATVRQVHLTDLATGADLGTHPRDAIHARVAVPAHRTAVIYIAAEVSAAAAREAVQRLATRLAALPADATAAQRAHLARAKDALAAGRYAKAMACVGRAEAAVPAVLTARLRDGGKTLDLRAQVAGPVPVDAPSYLLARFVPLPGRSVRLARDGDSGLYAASLPVSKVGVRYDYVARKYVTYHGGLEIMATGRFGARTLAESCVVDLPPAPR